MKSINRIVNAIYKMPSKRYLDYMRSKQWARTRNEYLASVEGWCEICHKAKACQVHHFTYARLGYEIPSDLCAVCVGCHHDIHCAYPDYANDNKQLKMKLKA